MKPVDDNVTMLYSITIAYLFYRNKKKKLPKA